MTDTAIARSLLLVDDDVPLLQRLAAAMEKRGFQVKTADQAVAAAGYASKVNGSGNNTASGKYIKPIKCVPG